MTDKNDHARDQNASSSSSAEPPAERERPPKPAGKKIRKATGAAAREAAPAGQPEPTELEHKEDFPVVAIGASAGGVHALQEFFSHLPDDTGVAYVVIIHLSRDYESNLPEILAKQTGMPVQSAADGQSLAPNQVFIIPANHTLSLAGRTLKLSEREEAAGRFMPIDRFFESLAEQLEEKAIGVILSGTGADGTLGAKAIKAAGGITIAQSEESAEFGEMPRNAIHSGQIDVVLEVAEIARELGELARHPHLAKALEVLGEEAPSGWERIQQLLRSTGIDFSQYKQSIVRRRISRRMAIHRIEALKEYAALLKDTPQELQALREDLLIKVTEFFRDPETFDALEKQVFPQIVERKAGDEPIRIWVPGCASGEEVYSLAIALTEFLGEQDSYLSVQIFGTDVSEAAVEKARRGFYSQAQVEGLGQGRLRKFFTPADGGFQVKKQLREMCIFARQDFVSDPPFSRLDLISCRNVLIYFGAALQKKVFPLFHYALNPGGFLVLGSSENIGQAGQLFSTVDKKNRIYARKNHSHQAAVEYWPRRQAKQLAARQEARPSVSPRQGEERNLQREVDRFLLRKLDPTAVLVDNELNVVQFRGDTRPYIEHHPGKASLNLLRMTRETLRLDLRTLLQRAQKQEAPQKTEHLSFENGQELSLTLEVSPLQFDHEPFFLIQFIPQPAQPSALETPAPRQEMTESALQQENRRLKRELASSREHLQQVVEEKDEALEDLNAANEEILSSNEELQSINEELETSKEELESSNEELTTVNTELQSRNEELAQAHGDLSNLILSVQIPFVIINDDLRIRRVSPDAERSLQIAPGDVGRPLTDLQLSFAYPGLEKSLLEVIHSGREVEAEIQARQGRWNLLRIRPWRAEKNGDIRGAVLALFDIDRLKRSMEEVEQAYKYSLRIVDTIKDPLLVLDESFQVKKANPAFYQKFQVGPQETEGQTVFELGAGQWNRPELRRLLAEILPKSQLMDNFPVEFDFPNLGPRTMLLSARKMKAAGSPFEAILLGIQDITEQKQLEDYLRRAKQAAEEASRAKSEFVANISHEIRTPLTVVISVMQYLEGTGLDSEQQRLSGMAASSAHSLLDLLDDLLDFSKIEVDKITIQSDAFDLRQNVGDAVNILRQEAGKKGLEIDLRIDPGVPQAVLGDRKRLRQVLVNLLGNAIKFTETGRIDVEVAPAGTVPAAEGRPDLLFSIRDTGTGIPATHLSRLFERFTQLDGSITRQYGGVGLGLAICRGLVERMGGKIWVESQPGKGSTFFFTLPLREVTGPATADSSPIQASPEETAAPAVATARILLGEDDACIRELIGMLLQRWGWKVIEAADGLKVLENHQTANPDLILMDLQMPGLDGLAAARTIREREAGGDRRIPIIALTAHAQIEDRKRCLDAGMDDVLTKPIDLEKLQSLILRYLES